MRAVVGLCVAGATLSGCVIEGDVRERTQLDSWYQAPNNQVDILWVVDDSCSMAEEQATLVNGFQSFVGQMEASGTDFHIGVISTSFDYSDPDRGVLIGDPPFLTSEDDYVSEFVERAQVGVEGNDKEKGLEAAAHALNPVMTSGGPNAGFLRPEAQLLIVVVSDEEDCSDRGALEGQPAEECYRQSNRLVPVTDFVQEFRGLKSRNDMVQLGGIIGVDDAICDDAYPGSRYLQVAAYTGGLIGDICKSDWSTMLADLGLTATGIRTSFQTTQLAKPDTLVVQMGPNDNNMEEVPEDPVNGWTYDEDTWYLSFGPNAIPERDWQITADYTVQPGASAPSAGTAE